MCGAASPMIKQINDCIDVISADSEVSDKYCRATFSKEGEKTIEKEDCCRTGKMARWICRISCRDNTESLAMASVRLLSCDITASKRNGMKVIFSWRMEERFKI